METPHLSGIVAMTRDGQVMGKNNTLPWSLPGDLKFFRATTLGHRIIMGRKTFESIGSKPLPKRENWVLSTRDLDKIPAASDGPLTSPPALRFFKRPEEIISALSDTPPGVKNFIIGGAEIFRIFWRDMDEIFVTWIDYPFEGDITFPAVDWNEFRIESERREIDPLPHAFCHMVRASSVRREKD